MYVILQQVDRQLCLCSDCFWQLLRDGSPSPSLPIRPVPPGLREGSAVAKYNFNPQTSTELALRRVCVSIKLLH